MRLDGITATTVVSNRLAPSRLFTLRLNAVFFAQYVGELRGVKNLATKLALDKLNVLLAGDDAYLRMFARGRHKGNGETPASTKKRRAVGAHDRIEPDRQPSLAASHSLARRSTVARSARLPVSQIDLYLNLGAIGFDRGYQPQPQHSRAAKPLRKPPRQKPLATHPLKVVHSNRTITVG